MSARRRRLAVVGVLLLAAVIAFAAWRFVLFFGTICAVRFFGVFVGIV